MTEIEEDAPLTPKTSKTDSRSKSSKATQDAEPVSELSAKSVDETGRKESYGFKVSDDDDGKGGYDGGKGGDKFGGHVSAGIGGKGGPGWGGGDWFGDRFGHGGASEMSSEISEGVGGIEPDYMRFVFKPCDHILSTMSSSTYFSCVEPELQRTVAIVKPEAMAYKDVILRALFEAGFQIVSRRVLHLTPEQVSEIYAKHYGTPSFPHLVVSVSAGPVLVLVISALNVINKWKKMIGVDGSLPADWFFPISMRKRYGLQESKPNMLHGSDNLKDADRENRYFNPESVLEPLLMEEPQVADFCNLFVNPTLLKGLTEVAKKKPIDPILYLAEWLLTNNPLQPRFPNNIAVSAT